MLHSSTVELRESIAQRARHFEEIGVASGVLGLPESSVAENTYVLYDKTFRLSDDSTWTVLHFDPEATFISDEDVDGCTLKIWSTRDELPQLLNAHTLAQWDYMTAEFGGNEVRLQVLCTGDARGAVSVSVSGAEVGEAMGPAVESLCSNSDRRQATSHAANARYVPGGSCTGWIYDDGRQRCFMTAGHCSGSGRMEFNVPTSGPVSPSDQYSVDSSSIQSSNGGVGNDWKYYGAYPNSNHGETAYQRQRSAYRETDCGNPGRLSHAGYGTSSNNLSLRQKGQPNGNTETSRSSNTLRYRFDTTGGDSGSPVSVGGTPSPTGGGSCGIHTHGGCSPSGGSNAGTWIRRSQIQNAVQSPRGVCSNEGAQEAMNMRYGIHFRGDANAKGPCVLDCATILQ